MEAVAWSAGSPRSAQPPCVSPVLGAYGRRLNDVLPEQPRQELKQFIPQLPGTAGDGKDETPGYIALAWLVRTRTPPWGVLAGLTPSAAEPRGFPPTPALSRARSALPPRLSVPAQ